VFRPGSWFSALGRIGTEEAIIVALVGINLLFNVVANASFKASATGGDWRRFLTWQVIGNLAGLITVLTFTGLLRYLPLRAAYPLTAGLAVVGVQVLAAALLFHEPISQTQWLGAGLVAVGIALIGGR
jgi:multidrug transporter EmrE-like cation transporter